MFHLFFINRTVSINHVSTQCHQSIDQINRSTQTDNDQYNQLEEYSSRTVCFQFWSYRNSNLLFVFFFFQVKLMENLKYLFENNSHNSLRYIYDELHDLILVIHQLIISIQSSPIICNIDNRTCRMISSTPSRQIDPITMKRSKVFQYRSDDDQLFFIYFSYVYFVKNRLMIMKIPCMNSYVMIIFLSKNLIF